jgi:uncharacterized protein YnzC (UPF0291/DUF896 family)
VSFVERLGELLAQAIRMGKNMTRAAKREQELIRELYFRKRRKKMRDQSRKQSREPEMAI